MLAIRPKSMLQSHIEVTDHLIPSTKEEKTSLALLANSQD